MIKVSPETLKRMRRWGITGPASLLPKSVEKPVLGVGGGTSVLAGAKNAATGTPGGKKKGLIEGMGWKEWLESLHPRGPGGKFIPSGNEPPAGMASKYFSTKTGLSYKWMPEIGKYFGGGVTLPTEFVQKHAGLGNLMPVKSDIPKEKAWYHEPYEHPPAQGPLPSKWQPSQSPKWTPPEPDTPILPDPTAPKVNIPLPKGMDEEAAKAMPFDPTWGVTKNWHQQAYGGVIVNNQGQFLLREPKNHFDSYTWTWPKGKKDEKDEHPVTTAMREVREETGHDTRIIGTVPGNHLTYGSNSNFYLMRSIGNNPDEMDNETWNTAWVTYDAAKQMIGRSQNKIGRERDLEILEEANNQLKKYGTITALWDESLHPRGPHGRFADNPSAKSDTPASTLKMHGWNKLPNSTKFEHNWYNPQHGYMKLNFGTKPAGGLKPLNWVHTSGLGAHVEDGPLSYRAKNLHTYLETIHQNATGKPFDPGPPVTPAETKPAIVPMTTPAIHPVPAGMAEEYTNPYQPEWTAKFNPATGNYDKYENGIKSTKSGMIDVPPETMKSQVNYQKVYVPTGSGKPVPEGLPETFVHPSTGEKFAWDKWSGEYASPQGSVIAPDKAKMMNETQPLAPTKMADSDYIPSLKPPPEGMAQKYLSESGGVYEWTGEKYQVTDTSGNKVGGWNAYTIKEWAKSGSIKEQQEPKAPLAQQEPPAGMYKTYLQYPQDPTYAVAYQWNALTGKYDTIANGKPTGSSWELDNIKKGIENHGVVPGLDEKFDYDKFDYAYNQKTGMYEAKPKGTVANPTTDWAMHEEPPYGLAKAYYNDKGNSGVWDSTVGKYELLSPTGEHQAWGTAEQLKKNLEAPGSKLTTVKPDVTSEPPAPEMKKSGPPEGMPIAVKGPKGGLYKWDDSQQLYVHSKTGKYTITPAMVEQHLTSQHFSYGKQQKPWTVAEGAFTKGSKPAEATAPTTPKSYYEPPDEKPVNPLDIKIIPPTSYAPVQPTPGSQEPELKGVVYKPPAVSTTPISGASAPPAPLFTFKPVQPTLGGAHEKYVFEDKNGNDWMFKPSATIGGKKDPVFAAADAVTSKIAMALRPGYAVETYATTLNVPGKGETYGSLQKMIPVEVLRGENPAGKFKDFVGRNLDSPPLQPWEVSSLQQEQVVDWLISNHDAHQGQFLRTSNKYVGSRSVIGIDKSQAFKFLGNDQLSADYHPNKEEQPPFYNKMWAQIKAGKTQFTPEDTLNTIKKAEGISDADYRDILKPYVQARFGSESTPDAQKFLDTAVARKDSLRADFEKFYSGVLGHKFVFEPIGDPNAKFVVNVASGKKAETLADHEVRPNNQLMIQAEIPKMMAKFSGDKADLGPSVISKWEQNYYKTDPTLPDDVRWTKAAQGAGMYPEMATKLGLLPKDLSKLREAIDNLKDSTGTTGAAWLRASAQDILNPGEKLKSRFSAMLQLEHEITTAKLSLANPSGTVDMYRGLHNPVAQVLRDAKKSGAATIQYHMMGCEGFSDNYSTSSAFSDGVVLHPDNLSIGNVISSHRTTPGAWSSIKSEAESIVGFPGKIMHLKPHEIMVKGSRVMKAAKKNNKVFHVDGTLQPNFSAYPAGWNAPGKKYPVELIEFDVVYPEPSLKDKVSAAIEKKLRKKL